MRLLPDGSIEFDPAELPAVLAVQAQMQAAQQQVREAPQAGGKPTPPTQPPALEQERPRGGATTKPSAQDAETQLRTHLRAHASQLTLLRVVKSHGSITIDALIAAIGARDAQTISGMMSGLTKAANRLSIARDDIVTMERDAAGVATYTAGPLLQRIDLEEASM